MSAWRDPRLASPQRGNAAPLGQERAGVRSVPGDGGPPCPERKGCGCGAASGGQPSEGKALQTPLRGVGVGGGPSSGQPGDTAWDPPRDGC